MLREIVKFYNRRVYTNLKWLRGTHLIKRNLEALAPFEPVEIVSMNGVEILGYGNTAQIRHIILGREMDEYKLLNMIVDELNPEDIFVDVGANFGLVTNYIYENSSAHVTCFEPYPPNIQLLEINKYLFNRNYDVRNLALGSSEGSVEFYASVSSQGRGGLAKKKNHKYSETINVEKSTLDSEIDSVDVIKIDVEGAELEVLKGAEDTLNQIKTIFLELHPNSILEEFGTNKKEVIKYLQNNGFSLDVLDGDISDIEPQENNQVIAKFEAQHSKQ